MSDTRKRSRKRFGGHARKKHRGSRELEVGAQGVLVTCNMNERKCTSETFRLLSEYADALYGPEQHTESVSEDEEGDEDAEAALQKEVSQIRSSMKSHQQRFTAVESGANNVLFIRTHGVDPEKLVHHILLDLHQTKKRKSRVILRMLPVSGTCRAFPEDMEKFLSEYLERWFKAPLRASYKICFKARNSSHNKRDDVIKAVAGLVDRMNPLNKVDLTNPELSIIIEIIKSVCCVSVVRDYMLLRKYNLQEVARESGASTGPQGHACAEGAQGHACAEGAQGHACAEGAQDHACADGAQDHACEEGPQEHACAEGPQGHACAEGPQGHACAEGAQDHACAEGAQEHACADGAQDHACEEGARESGVSTGPQDHACADGAQEHACAESGDTSNGIQQTEIQ